MFTILTHLKNRYFTQKGQGIVEYALILAAVVVLAGYLGASGTLGSAVEGAFQGAANALTGKE
ncbi:Flp family type IVb pilin [Pectinatus brassicae]|uniref:Pilus assembly protein Flp/PilA n=1 Tax=Pectinatus brassicae TaxID=862415 RepID=A0A840UPZ2_9FIRM|nr:pilin protein [Pectinatus brassicae]MBB5335083.1 pilus assembly protein Flp/PilA [Pectinatus brassicae]